MVRMTESRSGKPASRVSFQFHEPISRKIETRTHVDPRFELTRSKCIPILLILIHLHMTLLSSNSLPGFYLDFSTFPSYYKLGNPQKSVSSFGCCTIPQISLSTTTTNGTSLPSPDLSRREQILSSLITKNTERVIPSRTALSSIISRQ